MILSAWRSKSRRKGRPLGEQNACGGRPCIRSYRLRVSDVLGLIASGASNAEILEDYPILEPDEIVAALRYAARQTDHTVIAGAA